ncbi:MAG: hypothetical protein ABI041_11205 [Bdellovibrionia bacterium]
MKIPKWTFKQRLRWGLALILFLSIAIACGAIFALHLVIRSKDIPALNYSQDLIEIQGLQIYSQRLEAASVGSIFTNNPLYPF